MAETLHGVGVGSGAAVGPVVQVHPAPSTPKDEPAPSDPEAAKQQLAEVLTGIATEFTERSQQTSGTLSEVLSATAMMASDSSLKQKAEASIDSGIGPATAIDKAAEEFAAMFTAAGGYLAERVTDLMSVRDRAVARLTGQDEPGVGTLTEPSVIVARDLSPADTSALDLDMVVAIVTEEGGPTSHTAIIARQLGLPCVVRAEGALGLAEGVIVGVDAGHDEVVVEPSEKVQQSYRERAERLEALAEDTAPGGTADGSPIQLLANIGTVEDAEKAAKLPVEGVGLFRTEVLFLSANTAPTVEEQAEAYTAVLKAFAGRKVVVRTLDAGADKPLKFANQDVEENPALGIRGYRLVRTMPDLMATQLEALARAQEAAPDTELWVMAPMIATRQEAADFAMQARKAGIRKVGVMVEVPAVSLKAEAILAEVDFGSIGTNDLAQYTMATDRMQGALSDLLDRWQPAVLQLVAATAQAGKALARPVGVCGESAADPVMALVLKGMGITSLSMSTGATTEARYALRSHTLAECEAMAQAAMAADSAQEAFATVLKMVKADVRTVLNLD
ncbi:phosphoenolpyruvate--protein phosphotransferase [Enemella sp. A6]|uniref:phosphoenolpyruvate--protein phosphotransferase n=1 Tax=Enemella sp. A6 TaxID=3440152 RepID=UPI003EBCEDC0